MKDDLLPVLLELAIPHEDIGELMAVKLTAHEQRLLEECVHTLLQHLGSVESPPPRFEPIPDTHPLFYVFVYAAALPCVKAYHRARGIPEEISRLTFSDVGRNVAVHRRRTGVAGLNPVHWLMLHFCGTRYQIGRLQWEQAIEEGEPVLSIHIPAFCGPLTPIVVDESIERAKAFFQKHFPEVEYRKAVCYSWLLDEQLTEYLPADSNIVHFQRRFTLTGQQDNDESIQRFVDVDTPLHRTILQHLASGRHWRTGGGWFDLSQR